RPTKGLPCFCAKAGIASAQTAIKLIVKFRILAVYYVRASDAKDLPFEQERKAHDEPTRCDPRIPLRLGRPLAGDFGRIASLGTGRQFHGRGQPGASTRWRNSRRPSYADGG